MEAQLSARWTNLARLAAGLFVVAIICGIPYAWLRYRQQNFRNFRVVSDCVLYRSGQLSLAELKRVVHEYGIKTVITLRAAKTPGQTPPDQDEEDYCRQQELYHYRITPRAWETPHGSCPAKAGVDEFCRIM